MGKLSILATTSLMINVFAFVSLVINIYNTHNTTTYTWSYLFLNTFGQLLLIIYGLVNKAPEIYGPTILLFIGLLYIIYDKYTYSDYIIVEQHNK
jgi:hypothetical protein